MFSTSGMFSTTRDTMSTSGDVEYSWYPPHASWYPRCTELPLMYSWYPHMHQDIPRCTHDIPPMHSWYPSDVLMISLRCTHGIPLMYWTPPMYWTSLDVLNNIMQGETGCVKCNLSSAVKWMHLGPLMWRILCTVKLHKYYYLPTVVWIQIQMIIGQHDVF